MASQFGLVLMLSFAAYTIAFTYLVIRRYKLAQAELTLEIADALRPIGLLGDMEPGDLERWLERRDTILKKRAELRKTEKTGIFG